MQYNAHIQDRPLTVKNRSVANNAVAAGNRIPAIPVLTKKIAITPVVQRYRSGWVGRNGITEEDVNEFCRQYEKRKIRGHHSYDESHKEHENTTKDLKAFKSWFTKKYNRWK